MNSAFAVKGVLFSPLFSTKPFAMLRHAYGKSIPRFPVFFGQECFATSRRSSSPGRRRNRFSRDLAEIRSASNDRGSGGRNFRRNGRDGRRRTSGEVGGNGILVSFQDPGRAFSS